MSQVGQQTITIHILSNIPRSKDNKKMKFGQVIEYNRRNVFLQNHAKNEAGKLVPHLLVFFKKASYEVQASGLMFSFNIF